MKAQEKIWVIFLLLLGAVEQTPFKTGNLDDYAKENYHSFFKTIEAKMIESDIKLGKEIGWDTGKDKNFRLFITNNKDLPKTPFYQKNGEYDYYLDLSQKSNVKYLFDLMFHGYTIVERAQKQQTFYNAFVDLNNSLPSTLGKMPSVLNSFVIHELTR